MIPHLIDPLIDDLPLKQNEHISAVAAYDRNIYIGTSQGKLLHYHLFEDATDYLQLTLISVGNQGVTQLVTSEQSQRLFLIVDRTLLVFLLPELSPVSTRQLKNIRHICLMEDRVSLMLIKQSGIQLVYLQENSWKLLQEFRHEGAILGTAPMNNLVLLANGKSYETLDTRSGYTVPLFEYKSNTDVSPFIIPFETQDSKEYLLTIASDENTSIAQFINISGDVTRGTLTWLDCGYPRGGVIVDWPHAFAVFQRSIIVSSLETLDTVLEININNTKELEGSEIPIVDDFHIQKVKALFLDKSLEEVTGLPIEVSSGMVLFSKSKLFALHQENEIISANKAFHGAMESNDFEQFLAVAYGDSPYVHILKTMAVFLTEEDPIELLTKRQHGQLIIEPNLALRLLGYDYPFSMYPGLKDIIDMWDFKDEDITRRYLQRLKFADMSSESRILSYKLLPENELLPLVSEDNWTFSEDDKSIIEILIERDQIALVSYIYKTIPKLPAVAFAYKEFLFQHLNNDLVDDALNFLANVNLDEKDYSKLILEIIKLNKDKGYAFMRKSTVYREINQKILNGLSDDLKGEKDYALLRIELLESSFAENNSIRGELLDLVSSTLVSLYNDKVETYFKRLQDEYREMNKLSKNKWPKISWIDFLDLHKEQDYQMFIDLYLKYFELLERDDVYLEKSLFEYQRLCKTQDIPGLLDFGDYSTAERLALGKSVAQKKSFYKQEPVTTGVNKTSLLVIFEYYLKLYKKGQPVESAVQHFVESYNKYISPATITKLLPNQFPLVYLSKFLKTSIISLQGQSREKVMTKAIIKSELSRTKHLIKDFL